MAYCTALGDYDDGEYIKYKQDGDLDKNRAMNNVQKHNSCTNVSSSQTSRSYLHPN
jgi:hypothetical protein